jgi:DnaJ-class molecular chaperone
VVVTIILSMRDPYEWFGLSETASMPEVKSAYRAMMKTLHPDKLESGLPDWIKNHFNELLLQTQESYERIQRHKEETLQ